MTTGGRYLFDCGSWRDSPVDKLQQTGLCKLVARDKKIDRLRDKIDIGR